MNELVFPADFYVLKMEEDELNLCHTPFLLGRPFIRTARTKIDVFEGTMTMEFDIELICFNLFESMCYPSDVHAVFSIDVVDNLSEQVMILDKEDKLELVLQNGLHEGSFGEVDFESWNQICEVLLDLKTLPPKLLQENAFYLSLPTPPSKTLPSIIQPPQIELKPLPMNLKYMFLGDNETLHVILSSKLTPLQEEKLLKVLREYKEAIGWSIAEIKEISPSLCMHKILLEDDAKPVRQAQRRLNPSMMNVVKG